MTKRILVTGGAGFVGSHLCKRLVADGHDVICLDNYFTGTKDNVSALWHNPKFELVRHDVINPYFAEVDEIYNLACPASPIHYQYNPIKTTKTSVLGIINMLGLAKEVRAKIMQASTSEVYGDPTENPQSEPYWGNVNPIGERSCYDEGKRCGESILINSNIDFSIARIFNTYGPHMYSADGRAVSEFIKAAMYNRPLVLNGNGSQPRSFCYVDDTVDVLIKLMNTPYKKPINRGNPNYCVTINRLAEKIIKITGSDSYIQLAAKSPDDPYRRKPDITLARDILQWEPEVS